MRGTLRAINVAHRREERPIAKDVTAFSLGSAPSEFWVIRDGQLEYLVGGKARVLAEGVSGENISGNCLARPDRQGCVFIRNRSP